MYCMKDRTSIMTQQRNFDNDKAQTLTKIDCSRKCSIDTYILPLMEFINTSSDYVTTSSCSGRTVLFQKESNGEGKCLKSGCVWLYTSHKEADAHSLYQALQECKGNAVVKFEPFIMHIQCRDLQSAQILHQCASSCGYRNSGITAGKSGKFTVAIRSTQCLEVPLSRSGKTLVSEEYVHHVVAVANEKMADNLRRIDKFHAELREIICGSEREISQMKNNTKLKPGNASQNESEIHINSVIMTNQTAAKIHNDRSDIDQSNCSKDSHIDYDCSILFT